MKRRANGSWCVRSCTYCYSVVLFFAGPRARGGPWDPRPSNCHIRVPLSCHPKHWLWISLRFVFDDLQNLVFWYSLVVMHDITHQKNIMFHLILGIDSYASFCIDFWSILLTKLVPKNHPWHNILNLEAAKNGQPLRPQSVLEPAWAWLGAENAPRTYFHRIPKNVWQILARSAKI